MADNIGGFKINGTVVAGPTIGLVRRRCPDPVLELLQPRLNPAVAASLTITVAFRC
jgi:hypothetical protein